MKIVPHITPPQLKFLGPDFKIKKNIRANLAVAVICYRVAKGIKKCNLWMQKLLIFKARRGYLKKMAHLNSKKTVERGFLAD